jgi:hypothetical protein
MLIIVELPRLTVVEADPSKAFISTTITHNFDPLLFTDTVNYHNEGTISYFCDLSSLQINLDK